MAVIEKSQGHPAVSVVIPCMNEEQSVSSTCRRLTDMIRPQGYTYEFIFVDDGSTDSTLECLQAIAKEDSHVRILQFSRNFGHQAAVTAGIRAADGDAIVLIDADLQDPPEVIVEMLAKWRDGYDVVYGVRRRRDGETAFKKLTASMFYRILNNLSEIPIPLDTGDFRLISRRVANVLNAMTERHRFVRGLVSWAGFKQTPVYYDRAERFAGTTKYPFRKMLSFGVDGILSFSVRPLRIATTIGFAASSLAVLGILYSIALRIFTSNWVSGWTLLIVSILFMGGLQLFCIGIIGEYIGRIYDESKARPLYVAEEVTPKSKQKSKEGNAVA